MIYEPIPYRRCYKCQRYFPCTTEYFHRNKAKSCGLQLECKSCARARARDYATNHKDKRRTYRRAYHQSHRAEASKKAVEWGRANAARKNETNRRYFSTEQGKYARQVAGETYRVRKKVLLAQFTLENWQDCLEYFGGRCAICGRPSGLWHTLAQDHWIPVSKGGHYTTDNIIPLCHGIDGCNNKKNDSDPIEWLTATYGPRKAKRIAKRIQEYFDKVRR